MDSKTFTTVEVRLMGLCAGPALRVHWGRQGRQAALGPRVKGAPKAPKLGPQLSKQRFTTQN